MAAKGQVESSESNSGREGEIQTRTVHDRFAERMALRAEMESGMTDPTQAMDNISNQLLSADDEDALMEAAESSSMPNAQDLVNLEQRIFGFDIKKSNDEDKQNPRLGNAYLIIHSARLDNGQEFDWNTSSTLLVQTLMGLESFNAFDKELDRKGLGYRDLVIRASTTNAGNEVFRFQRLASRAI